VMPGKYGSVCGEEVREWELKHGLPHIPIISVTANSTMEDKIRYASRGIDAVIQKPMHPKSLGPSLLSFMEAYSRGDLLDSKFGQFDCVQHLRPEKSIMTTFREHTIPKKASPAPDPAPAPAPAPTPGPSLTPAVKNLNKATAKKGLNVSHAEPALSPLPKTTRLNLPKSTSSPPAGAAAAATATAATTGGNQPTPHGHLPMQLPMPTITFPTFPVPGFHSLPRPTAADADTEDIGSLRQQLAMMSAQIQQMQQQMMMSNNTMMAMMATNQQVVLQMQQLQQMFNERERERTRH